MTATVPSIADIVGPDREDEARSLLEQLLAIETDPNVAHVVRRRVLDSQPWNVIAAEIDQSAEVARRVFFQWAQESRISLTRTRTKRATT